MTPEEPSRSVVEEELQDGGFFMPSVKNTRELETEILETMQLLQAGKNVDSERIVGILNRSITAISHWSLQAQLAQLRGNVDDRQAVETSLLRKEMEFLIQKRPQTVEEVGEQLGQSCGSMRTPPYSRSCESPRKPTKKTHIGGSGSVGEEDAVALTLVENKKPHPRMRRTSDNPSTNEYVRVFHLRRR